MPTLSTLKTRVLTRLIDTPATVQAEVVQLLNDAIRLAEDTHDFQCMEYTAAYVTSAGFASIGAKPADWKKARGKPYRQTDLGNQLQLATVEQPQQTIGVYNVDDVGAPRIIIESDPIGANNTRTFLVQPIPDGFSDYTDGEYRIYVPYYRYLPDLGESDSNWFTDNGSLYLIAAATSAGFALNEDEQREALWAQKMQGHLQQLVSLDKRARVARVGSLFPNYAGVRPPHVEV